MSPGESAGDGESPSKKGALAFWTSLPGVLTGAAAVITALVSVFALWHPSGGSTAAAPGGTGSQTPAPAMATAAETTLAMPSGAVIAHGALVMKTPDGADLEGGLVGNAVTADLYLYCGGGRCVLTSMTGRIEPTDAAADRSTCIAALKARRDGSLDLSQLKRGTALCLQTKAGHVAGLTPTAVPGVGSATFSFRYTVWG